MRHPKHKGSESEVIYSTPPARESAPPSCLGWALHTVRQGRRRMRGTLLTQHWKWQSIWSWGSRAKRRCSDAARFTSRPFVSRGEASATTRSSLSEAAHPALVATAHGEGKLLHAHRWWPWAESWSQSSFDTFTIHLWHTRQVPVCMNTHFLSAGKSSRAEDSRVGLQRHSSAGQAHLFSHGTRLCCLQPNKQEERWTREKGTLLTFRTTRLCWFMAEQPDLPPPARLSRQLNGHKSRKTQWGEYQSQLGSSADI